MEQSKELLSSQTELNPFFNISDQVDSPESNRLTKKSNSQNHKQNSVQKSNTLLYRYEYNGVIVYDSHSRKYHQPPDTRQFQPKKPTPNLHQRLEGALQFDKYMFSKMGWFPPEKYNKQQYTLVYPQKHTLEFDSRFQSGNLWKAIKVSQTQYNLLLDFDQQTKGHTQWYYFSVQNQQITGKIQFNIINLIKFQSLYNNGLKPVVYSTKKFQETGQSWVHDGEQICYFKNHWERQVPNRKLYYFTLSFTYTFEHPNDKVYFAHCYPYTYSDLLTYISQNQCQDYMRIDPLCKSIAGNICYILTITEHVQTYTSFEAQTAKMSKTAAGRRMIRMREQKSSLTINQHTTKKGVIFTARIHPGESNSSIMMEGIISFLLSDDPKAYKLRKNCVFKIIPMLNPDGVVYGNYRCSLLGVDLNRRWDKPNKLLHPTIFHSKQLFKMFSQEHEIIMFCDLHGHSIAKNSFMYSCASKSKEYQEKRKNILVKMNPFSMSQKNKAFVFPRCRFRIQKQKMATSRIVFYKELDILNSHTFQISFYGTQHKAWLDNKDPQPEQNSEDAHFQPFHIKNLGVNLCQTLLIYLHPLTFQKRLRVLTETLTKQIQPPLFIQKHTQTNTEFSIANALDTIGEEPRLLQIQEHNQEDSDSSDSCKSDNDDCFIEFKYKQKKKAKKVSQTPTFMHVPKASPHPQKCHKSCSRHIQKTKGRVQALLDSQVQCITSLIQSWDKKLLRISSNFANNRSEQQFYYYKNIPVNSQKVTSFIPGAQKRLNVYPGRNSPYRAFRYGSVKQPSRGSNMKYKGPLPFTTISYHPESRRK